jgi:uncharacterized peroxidase-related enzyme
MVTEDEDLVAALRQDWRTAPITPAEHAMLEYVEKLTLHPGDMQPADVRALHAAGFDDRGVLQIAVIAGYFAYLNRVADGVGVGRGPKLER